MKHELKIVMSYEDGKDAEGARTVTAPRVLVSIDEEPIGCMQELKFEAFAHNGFPRLEVIFPNLRDANIDVDETPGPSYFVYDVDRFVRIISDIPNTKVSFQDLNPTVNVAMLEEIGTEGFIDSFPMKKRREPEKVFNEVKLEPFKPEES